MPLPELPFSSLAQRLLADLAHGRCASIVGLSNTGKSTLMRSLGSSEALRRFQPLTGRQGLLVYVDCNQAVAVSSQAFYEVVLRSILDSLASALPGDISATLRRHHETITDADNAFSASLSFNLGLTELCERHDARVCLLMDEFDEIYAGLDERTLLNLRALKDRSGDKLLYLTATARSLPESRSGAAADEFAEMFATSTHPMPPLKSREMDRFLKDSGRAGLTAERRRACHVLSGGHPGLLAAVGQVLASLPKGWSGDLARTAGLEPALRAECLKMWTQLRPEEQDDLVALVLNAESGKQQARLQRLESLGLVREGVLFSPIFAEFVGRRGRAAEVTSQGVHLDPDSGDVWVDGVRIPLLTDLEFRLLRLLYERQDKLTDKYRIVTAVWGEEYLGEVDDARVEKLVSRLRAQIEPDPANPRYLVTQRGRGYKLLSRPRSS